MLALPGRGREQIARLGAIRVTATPGAQPAADFESRALAAAAEVLASLATQADVLIPFYAARRRQHEGHDDEADALFGTALDRARDHGKAGRSVQILVLAALGRYDEAWIIVDDLLGGVAGVDADDTGGLWAATRTYDKPYRASRRPRNRRGPS
jgi:hypothetical protein